MVGISETELERLASAVCKGAGKDSANWKQLEAVLSRWQERLQARPVYAGFHEHFANFLGATPAQDKPGWADELKDLLDFYHLVAGTRIVVFRYRVQDIPKVKGAPNDRSLTAPTVLDQDYSEAFCPSPGNADCGHAVDLQARLNLDSAVEAHVVRHWSQR